MIEAISIGDPPIEIRLRRDPRARRMTLRHRAASSSTVLTLPPGVPVARAKTFVLQNEGWLRRQIAAAPGRIPVRHGVRLPFRGGEITVLPAPDGRSRLDEGVLMLAGLPDRAGPRAATVLREAARAARRRRRATRPGWGASSGASPCAIRGPAGDPAPRREI